MNSEKELLIFIYYMVYIFFKRMYDLYISFAYPIERNIQYTRGFEQIEFRKIFNTISIFWVSYMILFFKLNAFMKGFLYLILANIIYYFLFEEDYIYYFIDKRKTDPTVMQYLDNQGAKIINVLFLVIYFYVIYRIFPMIFH